MVKKSRDNLTNSISTEYKKVVVADREISGKVFFDIDRNNILSNADTSWELIEPNFDQSISSQKLAQKFFAVSKDITNENIIFLGGNMSIKENMLKITITYIGNKNSSLILYLKKNKFHLPFFQTIDFL